MYYELQKMYQKYIMCNTDSILQIQEMYYIYVKYRYPGLMNEKYVGN